VTSTVAAAGLSLERSRRRIEAEIAQLSAPPYTAPAVGITRHAYTEEYRLTLEHFAAAFEAIGFDVHYDPVGTLVASNRPPGKPCFGIGSHCDANRNGGPYDGTLGVVCALEVARLAVEQGLDLPLRAFAFLEEEGSGFGVPLLGSRLMLGDIDLDTAAKLRDEHGASFVDAARAAGFEPDRLRESAAELDGLLAFVELHIEQARSLEDNELEIGVVEAIAGMIHADLTIVGRADHAGGTAMDSRSDPMVTAGEIVAELEPLTRRLSGDAVGTVGSLGVAPGLINVIPASVNFTLDLRSASGDHLAVLEALLAFAHERAASRGQAVHFHQRSQIKPTPMDRSVVDVLGEAADACGARWTTMVSGAAHDAMLVARRVPTAMVFVPCREGISHAPDEYADPAHGALGAHVMLDALVRLNLRTPERTECDS
jgi:hydantoinase/carbamoylase family amidase